MDDRESRRSIVAVIAGILISGPATGVSLSFSLGAYPPGLGSERAISRRDQTDK